MLCFQSLEWYHKLFAEFSGLSNIKEAVYYKGQDSWNSSFCMRCVILPSSGQTFLQEEERSMPPLLYYSELNQNIVRGSMRIVYAHAWVKIDKNIKL